MRISHKAICVILLTTLLGCAATPSSTGASASLASSSHGVDKTQAISVDVPPRIGGFRTTPVPTPLLPRVPGRGDCAPRYADGTPGSCVNDTPCRGFGVRDGGQVICACFVKRGGCEVDERCDVHESRCVKEDLPEFNITP